MCSSKWKQLHLHSYTNMNFSVPNQKTSPEFQAFCRKAQNGEPLQNNPINVDISVKLSGKLIKNTAMEAIIQRHKTEILREFELLQNNQEDEYDNESEDDSSNQLDDEAS